MARAARSGNDMRVRGRAQMLACCDSVPPECLFHALVSAGQNIATSALYMRVPCGFVRRANARAAGDVPRTIVPPMSTGCPVNW